MEPTDLTAMTSIHKFGQIEISQDLINMADMDGFAQKMGTLTKRLDGVNGRMNEITNAPWWQKFFFDITGKTAKTEQEAMQMYGEVLKVVLQLSAIHTIFGKKLYDQQQVGERLSRQILDQNELQNQQDEKHNKSLDEFKRRQGEILKLVEGQNTVLKILPELKDGLDALGSKFKTYDELREVQAKDVETIKGDVTEITKGLTIERDKLLSLETKFKGVVIALVILAIGTVTGIVVLASHLR